MPRNNAKKWAIISLIITLLSLIMIVAGITIESGDYIWMFAVGLMLGLTFLICFFVFFSQARRLDRMFNQKELLAHWAFDPVQQLQKAAEEYKARKKGNRILLMIMTVFFVVIGGFFVFTMFDDLEEASFFLVIMFSVFVLIAVIALVAPRLAFKRMIHSLPEVFVGPYGAWVMGEYVQWKAPMTRLNRVIFEQNENGVIIAIDYAIRQRYGYQQHMYRIPIPAGKEQEAHDLAVRIASINNVQFVYGSTPT